MKKKEIRELFVQAKQKAERFKSVKYFHHKRETALAKKAHAIAEAEYKKHQAGKR